MEVYGRIFNTEPNARRPFSRKPAESLWRVLVGGGKLHWKDFRDCDKTSLMKRSMVLKHWSSLFSSSNYQAYSSSYGELFDTGSVLKATLTWSRSFRWPNDCVLVRYKDINRNDRRLIVGSSCEPCSNIELFARTAAWTSRHFRCHPLMMMFWVCWPLNHNYRGDHCKSLFSFLAGFSACWSGKWLVYGWQPLFFGFKRISNADVHRTCSNEYGLQ